MSIELKIVADSAEDLRNQLAGLLGPSSIPQNSAPLESAQPAARKAKTQATAPSPAPSDTSPKTQSEAPTTEADGGAEPASPSDDAALDYAEHIKPAVLKVSAKHGRDGVLKLLAKYEAANAQMVPAERWRELLADVDEMLAKETL